ncbi:MAG: beta-galactosidase [Steroidobacteraceae bacterium]
MSDATLLGVCYYPEHWAEEQWADDARRMRELGLSRVRIGEFAWARIEPAPGLLDWTWLDRAIGTLAGAGLKIILGTPTATPPRWLLDEMPDMLAVDAEGKPRQFGSRRHYCFSHAGYRAQCRRIVRAMAGHFGRHPAVVAWQVDNEYGCHDTVLSYSEAARQAFREWLAKRYGHIQALNEAWGNVFWSMDYADFEQVDLPNLTVTEANPAHRLDFQRFSSDQVVAFNREQVEILRELSPGRTITHNFMGFFTDFDHHAVAADLDVASWDSYPLGFLEQADFPGSDKLRYARQGHPDIAAFHHDLYRGCGRGRWWVMEQQPGPVNWARNNPAPLPGMVRLWTIEAHAHGAELVSYFRWRQLPFAQEQMHAGLLRPDSVEDLAAGEVRQVAGELQRLGAAGPAPAPVALLFGYASEWMTRITPHGERQRALRACFEWYSALRRLGLDVDILAPESDLSKYRMVVVPCLPWLSEQVAEALAGLEAPVLIGPRAGSKTREFSIPPALAPGPLQRYLQIKVVRVESLRPGWSASGPGFAIQDWLEHLETDLIPELCLDDGHGVLYRQGNLRYLSAGPDERLLGGVLQSLAAEAGLDPILLPQDLRVRRAGDLCFAFNYGPSALSLAGLGLMNSPANGHFLIGSVDLPPAGLGVWRQQKA